MLIPPCLHFLPAACLGLALLAPAARAEPGTFEVGAFWQPPAKPVDWNTSEVWEAIAQANLDFILAHRLAGTQDIRLGKADNETGIAHSHKAGVKLLCTDSSLLPAVHTPADEAALAKAIAPYRDDPRVAGLVLRDEPFPPELEGVANAYRVAKRFAPALRFNVNLLGYSTQPWMKVAPGKLALSTAGARGAGLGLGAAPGAISRIGQTWVAPGGMTFLDGIEIEVPAAAFAPDESLIMRLWTSPARAQLLGEVRVEGASPAYYRAAGGKAYPYFRFQVPVLPGAEYFLELSHGGGGDRSVSLEAGPQDLHPGGTLFLDGRRQARDLWFRVYGKPRNDGTDYENYLDQWLDLSGADFVEYDFYPFREGTGELPEQFLNAELVRDRALAVGATYGAYLQCTEVRDVLGNLAIRTPTVHEARYLAHGLLAYGFRKLTWFTYWLPDAANGEVFAQAPVSPDGVPGPMYPIVATLSAELRQLGRTLKDLTSREVYHTGPTLPRGTTRLPSGYFLQPEDPAAPLILGHLLDPSGRSFVMPVLRDYQNPARLAFTLWPRPAALYEISKRDGKPFRIASYDAQTGRLSLDFLPGEGHLLMFPKGFVPDDNLARGAIVTASSSRESTREGWGLARLRDGRKGPGAGGYLSEDRPSTDHDEWIRFDLGGRKGVRQVQLFPLAGGQWPATLRIAVSSDGVHYAPAATLSGPSLSGPGPVCASLETGRIRYLRLEGTGLARSPSEPGRPFRLGLSEVEILAQANHARCARVVATSSVETPGWGVAGLQDGIGFSDRGSHGYSSDGEPTRDHVEALTFDLGVPRLVREVTLFPRQAAQVAGEGFPLDVGVALSDDGRAWRTVLLARSLAARFGDPKILRFPAQAARFVKIEGTRLRRVDVEAARPYRMQFAEVEIR